jgi:paraquat-inducible protein A
VLRAVSLREAIDHDSDGLSECHDCGLIQRVPSARVAALVSCGRCGATLRQVRHNSVVLSAVCATLGLSLFALAFALPTASVWMQGGRFATSDLVNGPQRLEQNGAWALALAVVLTLLLFPLVKLATVVAMSIGLWFDNVPRWLKTCFSALPMLTEWAMIDVFLLGATIALFRLRAWMLVSFGPALFALGGAALCSIAVDAALDRSVFWHRVPLRPVVAPPPAAPSHILGCHSCGLVENLPDGAHCRRCEQSVHARKRDSVRRTWALISSAALLAIPANVLPVMTIIKLGRGGPSTILGGTLELMHVGFWGLAALVFVASILVPLVKLGALSFLLVSTSRGSTFKLPMRTRLFRVVALIGRWSMLDVFATMMLVTLARFGWLGTVTPGLGASAFCGVVVLTMLASKSFDPRLMWDAAGANTSSEAKRTFDTVHS